MPAAVAGSRTPDRLAKSGAGTSRAIGNCLLATAEEFMASVQPEMSTL